VLPAGDFQVKDPLLAALLYWLTAAAIPVTVLVLAAHQATFLSQVQAVPVPCRNFQALAALLQQLSGAVVNESVLRSMQLWPESSKQGNSLMYS
jgi:hypothetical protein